MKFAVAFVLLASCLSSALAEDLESRVLPSFSPPSPPPPPLVGFGCPSLELAFVLNQYSYLNFGNDEGTAVCEAILAKTPYKYAKCEFNYRYGYRSSNQLPALLDGVIAGPNPSTVVFMSIKFGIPQLPNQQKWYDYAEGNRTKLMNVFSYEPTLQKTIRAAIDWDGKVTTLENCAAFMYGYDTFTSDQFELEFTYWAPHPSPPDVLPSDPDFVPTPPFLYFGGKACPCYYDVDILNEEGDEIETEAQDFDNPTCQVFLNSDNVPASKFYIFPDSYWSAFQTEDGSVFGYRGCFAEMPKPDPVVCKWDGVYSIESMYCGEYLSFSIAGCSLSTYNLRTAQQSKGKRKQWMLNHSFNSEGKAVAGPIEAHRTCEAKFISNTPGKLAEKKFRFKIVPTGSDCSVVHLYGLSRPKFTKYLGVTPRCTGLKFTGVEDNGSIFRLRKLK